LENFIILTSNGATDVYDFADCRYSSLLIASRQLINSSSARIERVGKNRVVFEKSDILIVGKNSAFKWLM